MRITLTTILILIAINSGFSQSKEIELVVDKQLIEYEFLKDGGFYLQFGKQMELASLPAKNKNFLLFSPELKKELDHDIPDLNVGKNLSGVNKVNGITTPSGKISGFYRDATMFSEKDAYFFSGKEYKMINGSDYRGPLKMIKTLDTDNYHICFGKEKARKDKNIMAGMEYNDLYFYRTDIKTLQTKLIKIDLPAESFPNSKMFYQYQSHTNEKVFFILNELLNDGNKNICNLVSFDYEGKLIDRVPFNMELENNKKFSHFNVSLENSIPKANNGGSYSQVPTDGATVKIKISPDGTSFYSYGLFNDEDKKTLHGIGYYIYKYDFKGNLLYKNERLLDRKENKNKKTSKVVYGYSGLENLLMLNDNRIGFWIRDNSSDDAETQFFMINGKDGEIIKNIRTVVLFSRNFELSRKKSLGLTKSLLYIQNFDQIRMDLNTVFAMNFFPEVDKYINSKTGMRFESQINENGVFMIQENGDEKGYKLLKFDL